MAMTTRKNFTVKALQSQMASEKKFSHRSLLEWCISCNTNSERGDVFDQWELMKLYSRISWICEHGATKICHLENHEGEAFKYIVIKRFQQGGQIIDGINQMNAEIKCWVKFAEKPEADMLCPILKYFTSKSDKVSENSETMKNNVIIIAQRAVYVSNAKDACREAEELNKANGYKGEAADSRYAKLAKLSRDMGWWDAMHNGGNSGVIFDYHKRCFKAVFIDYAL